MLEGCQAPINENGETRYKTIKIVDFNHISNNTFKAINRYTIIEHSEKRPDIIIFVNGLPLVVVELKSTVREDVKLIDGYHQLKGYQEVHIPTLFYYNQFMIVSDGVQARAGTVTSSWSRFFEWKKIEADDEVTKNMPTYKTLFYGMFRKERLLDIINNYLLWSDDSKILSAYHQELVETVNKNMTIDWDIRKDARARMRIEIKKLLIKYNYPPNKSEKAIQTIIRQAELKSKGMVE